MKKVYKIAGIIAGAAALVCAGIGIAKYTQESRAGEGYEQIRKEVKKEENTEKNTEEKQDTLPVEIPIDFAALQEQNPDVYAWITVPGTAIDYPILQKAGDNGYYLTHTIDNTESPEGAIFTEDYNSKDFEDVNTVIYGHDMKNGSMFQSLHNYMDKSFFDEYRDIVIYTPDSIRHYQIFAAYLYDDRHLLQSFEFDNKIIYQAYLDSIFSMRDMNAFVDSSAEVGTDDKIITLSTCYGTQSDKRYLVQAVLVTIEK